MKRSLLKNLLLSGGVSLWVGVASLGLSSLSMAETPMANWNPKASETLIKMPTVNMEKQIERDFKKSSLALAITDSSKTLGLKRNSLNDLNQTLKQVEGEMNIEVRHQILAEKRDYLNVVGDRNEMRRQASLTRKKLYERLLDDIRADKRSQTPEKIALIASQEAARARMDNSLNAVDAAIFADGPSADSKYNQEYGKNQALIEKLFAQVDNHRLNKAQVVDGEILSKQDYLRRLISDSEADLALISQEDQILGLMSKLVAFDAMALSEEIAEAQELAVGIDPAIDENPLHNIADMFVQLN